MSEKTLEELTRIAEKLEKLEIQARRNNVRLARLCDQAYAKECRETVTGTSIAAREASEVAAEDAAFACARYMKAYNEMRAAQK
jgi:hypothetical protein